jgi:pSer/pThr/pTyr-binding forkhead associated (FHA) protein
MQPGIYLIQQASGQSWRLNPQEANLIGRGLEAEHSNLILLPHSTISKLHARIWLEAKTQQWYLENLSRNGTTLNGHGLVEKTVLRHGDVIAVGPYRLLFYESLAADAGTVEVEPWQRFPGERNTATSGSFGDMLATLLILATAALFLFLCFRKIG